MDVPLPSTRELELEMLLREREGQVVQLSDEVSRLRLYLSSQPAPSTAEPVTLPPTFASLLLPHIPHLPQGSSPAGSSNNSTTTAALTQRVKVLQEENDELYDILKKRETGRLKEEVQSLKRIVDKLEGALRESHQVIISLSHELDKSYQAFASTSATRTASPQNHFHNNNNGVKPYSRSHSNSTAGGRLPPTGPRAHSHKKQRLSQADQEETSPSMRSNVSLPSSAYPTGNGGRRGRSRSRSRSPRGKSSAKMEVDEVDLQQQQRRSPERNRERWDRDRGGRDRDRDGNRSRRNGGGGGGRGGSRRGGGGGGAHSHPSSNFAAEQGNSGGSNGADRTLAERMGLGL
ncbi:hypothetical protein BT96DRAFT_958000 [Gymnopus androsaceus JB14]|uniref:Uncharacterized protein n=1 Tax=Gymnopus androsaceus JB14 TaxID=1447944 RepID=A0A6A4HFA3_9AGAR|nr:hypothetical protein BT96DRAFT_958000 [Gymnopus androsaceus JB14]